MEPSFWNGNIVPGPNDDVVINYSNYTNPSKNNIVNIYFVNQEIVWNSLYIDGTFNIKGDNINIYANGNLELVVSNQLKFVNVNAQITNSSIKSDDCNFIESIINIYGNTVFEFNTIYTDSESVLSYNSKNGYENPIIKVNQSSIFEGCLFNFNSLSSVLDSQFQLSGITTLNTSSLCNNNFGDLMIVTPLNKYSNIYNKLHINSLLVSGDLILNGGNANVKILNQLVINNGTIQISNGAALNYAGSFSSEITPNLITLNKGSLYLSNNYTFKNYNSNQFTNGSSINLNSNNTITFDSCNLPNVDLAVNNSIILNTTFNNFNSYGNIIIVSNSNFNQLNCNNLFINENQTLTINSAQIKQFTNISGLLIVNDYLNVSSISSNSNIILSGTTLNGNINANSLYIQPKYTNIIPQINGILNISSSGLLSISNTSNLIIQKDLIMNENSTIQIKINNEIPSDSSSDDNDSSSSYVIPPINQLLSESSNNYKINEYSDGFISVQNGKVSLNSVKLFIEFINPITIKSNDSIVLLIANSSTSLNNLKKVRIVGIKFINVQNYKNIETTLSHINNTIKLIFNVNNNGGDSSADSNSTDSHSTDSHSTDSHSTDSHSTDSHSTDSHSTDSHSSNSHSTDSHSTDSHSTDSHSTDSHSTDSHSSNSHSTDSHSTDSHSTDSHSTDSHSTDSHSSNSHSTDSHSTDSHSTDSHSTDSHSSNSHSTDSHSTDSHSTNSHSTDSHSTDSHSTDSHSTDSHSADSHSSNSHSTDSHNSNSHSTDSHSTDSHSSNSHSTDSHSTNSHSTDSHSASSHSSNSNSASSHSTDSHSASSQDSHSQEKNSSEKHGTGGKSNKGKIFGAIFGVLIGVGVVLSILYYYYKKRNSNVYDNVKYEKLVNEELL